MHTAPSASDLDRDSLNQRHCTEEEYLALSGNRLLELCDGVAEMLPLPSMKHQLILGRICTALSEFVSTCKLGIVLIAPFPVRLCGGKFREPDLMFMFAHHASRMQDLYWDGADLVMEVVSSDDRRRDLDVKRVEYAQACIPEYWIVDPQLSRISVLRLDGYHYVVHGEFGTDAHATSVLLSGFSVDVAALFDEARAS